MLFADLSLYECQTNTRSWSDIINTFAKIQAFFHIGNSFRKYFLFCMIKVSQKEKLSDGIANNTFPKQKTIIHNYKNKIWDFEYFTVSLQQLNIQK